jgi:hypothetical protein
MSLQQLTQLLQPQNNNVIPPGKFIYIDETFLAKPAKLVKDESFPRQGKELVTPYFSFQHGGQEFTPVYSPAPSMTMNYGTYIWNIVDGYQ